MDPRRGAPSRLRRCRAKARASPSLLLLFLGPRCDFAEDHFATAFHVFTRREILDANHVVVHGGDGPTGRAEGAAAFDRGALGFVRRTRGQILEPNFVVGLVWFAMLVGGHWKLVLSLRDP